jgi:endonuclease/exonuclease/phosphatase family metal-dependent hydrolase
VIRTALTLLVAALVASPLVAQWDPDNGDWGKDDADDVRVMTWNVKDNINSDENKGGGFSPWEATARIVASLQPDVLILQEAGDTGSGGDSVSDLETTLDLWLHGGLDVFNGNTPVGAYVQLYAPGYDLPHVFVSTASDGFNRNVILSRFPFGDLNGDTNSTLSDMFFILPDLYSTGGTGGIRGWQHAEIDLPNGTYLGDLVVGNSHLKSGGSASDKADRLKAGQNIAYYIDGMYNGLGTGSPDPNGKILENPLATHVLDANTVVVTGGDWNEDESSNGTKGPADWIVQAAVADSSGGGDGTDKDRSDMTYDAATEHFSGSDNTFSSSKLDYLAWQDSVAVLRRSAIFNSSPIPAGLEPPELAGFPINPQLASGSASDHRPVLCDFILPQGGGGPTADVLINEVDADQTSTDDAEFIELYAPDGATSLQDHFLVLYNGSNDLEYLTFDLDGQSVPADGFFVVGPSTASVPNTDHSPGNFPATNAIQNGADAVALYHDPSGTLAASSFLGTTVGSPPAAAVLVDALVYDTSDSDDAGLLGALTPGQPQVNENDNALKDIESNSRVPDGGLALITTTYAAQEPTPGTSNLPLTSPWSDLGCALAGVTGDPLLTGTGTLLPNSSNSVDLTNAAPSALCAIFLSDTETPVGFKGGTLKPIPILLDIVLVTDPTGGVALPFTWPATGANPATLILQYAIQDFAAIKNVSLSNALRGDAP